jgi:hypothetical protein
MSVLNSDKINRVIARSSNIVILKKDVLRLIDLNRLSAYSTAPIER